MATLTITSVLKHPLWVFFSFTTVTARPSLKQLPITCDAGECSTGESASVTCHFGTDIRRNQRHFAVVMYPFHVEKSFSGIDVLRCHWTQPSSPECRVMDGFVFHQGITDTITVNISKATTQMAGIYACELVPSNGRTKHTCNLNVTERSLSAAQMQSALRRPSPQKEGSIPEPSTYYGVRGSPEESDSIQDSLLEIKQITISALVLLITFIAFIAIVIVMHRLKKKKERGGDTDSEGSEVTKSPAEEEGVPLYRAQPAGSGNVKQRTPVKSKPHTDDRASALQGKLLQLFNH